MSIFFRNKALTRSLLTLLLVVLTGCGGGDGDSTSGGSGGAGDPTEVGTWTLTTVDGVQGNPDIMLTLTGSNYTFVGPDCTETGTYTVSGNVITSAVSTVTGTSTVCQPVGTTFTQTFTITETTLTLIDSVGGVTVWTRT